MFLDEEARAAGGLENRFSHTPQVALAKPSLGCPSVGRHHLLLLLPLLLLSSPFFITMKMNCRMNSPSQKGTILLSDECSTAVVATVQSDVLFDFESLDAIILVCVHDPIRPRAFKTQEATSEPNTHHFSPIVFFLHLPSLPSFQFRR